MPFNNAHQDLAVVLVTKITQQICPLLAGHPPEIQGAILANLTSMWLAGHPKQIRDRIARMHNDMVRDLVAPSERELFRG